MIGSREAESMDYLTYKVTFWDRMGAWWRMYAAEHPERQRFISERIAFADDELDHWMVRSGRKALREKVATKVRRRVKVA